MRTGLTQKKNVYTQAHIVPLIIVLWRVQSVVRKTGYHIFNKFASSRDVCAIINALRLLDVTDIA